MTMGDALALVRAWHDAVNTGDIEKLGGLVADDFEVGGPRGSDYGRDVLIDWVERSGIQMEPAVWYRRGKTVIVCEQASWPGDDGTPGDPQPVASVFVVRDNRITSIVRHPDELAAFAATGLAESDRVTGLTR